MSAACTNISWDMELRYALWLLQAKPLTHLLFYLCMLPSPLWNGWGSLGPTVNLSLAMLSEVWHDFSHNLLVIRVNGSGYSEGERAWQICQQCLPFWSSLQVFRFVLVDQCSLLHYWHCCIVWGQLYFYNAPLRSTLIPLQRDRGGEGSVGAGRVLLRAAQQPLVWLRPTLCKGQLLLEYVLSLPLMTSTWKGTLSPRQVEACNMSIIFTLDTVGIPDHHHISQCNFICLDGQGKQAEGQMDVSMAPRSYNPQPPEVVCLPEFVHLLLFSTLNTLKPDFGSSGKHLLVKHACDLLAIICVVLHMCICWIHHCLCATIYQLWLFSFLLYYSVKCFLWTSLYSKWMVSSTFRHGMIVCL